MTNNAAYGGAFVEAGPLICHTQHIGKFETAGMVLDKSFSYKQKRCDTTNSYGLVVGIGRTSIYNEHQLTYGLSFNIISSKASDAELKAKAQSKINLHTSWTF
jgi:hypothetical protein